MAPLEGRAVPVNLPGFPVSEEIHNRVDAGSPPFDLRLSATPDGPAIPLERKPLTDGKESLFVPKVALAPGKYWLTYPATCSQVRDQPVAGGAVRREITLLAESPIPISAGTITVPAQTMGTASIYNSISCGHSVNVARIRPTLVPSAELVPYLSVARLHVAVDGKAWASSVFGGGKRFEPDGYDQARRDPFDLFRVCSNPSGDAGDYDNSGLLAGVHTGTVTVEIPGATRQPAPISFSFALTCPAEAGRDGGVPVPPDGGGSGEGGDVSAQPDGGNSIGGTGGGGSSDVASSDQATSGALPPGSAPGSGGAPDVGTAPPGSSPGASGTGGNSGTTATPSGTGNKKDGGCSFGGGAGGGVGVGLALGWLFVMGRRRRRS